MSTVVGKNIAVLRKEKGIKQEELANFVGVSAQAVSKWENGGVPDIDLLPSIADYFGVSIDSLFNRKMTDYCGLPQAVRKYINGFDKQERMEAAYQLCWELEVGLSDFMEALDFSAEYDSVKENTQVRSSIMYDSGFTRMGIGKKMQYFLIVPDYENNSKTLIDGTDYASLFEALSDNDLFNVLIFLNKRLNNKAFTPNLLVKNLDITLEKASEIIKLLEKYDLVHTIQIEVDDEVQDVYSFTPNPAVIGLLIFAKEIIINKPTYWDIHCSQRKKPYLTE